jgi:hypothetical protein
MLGTMSAVRLRVVGASYTHLGTMSYTIRRDGLPTTWVYVSTRKRSKDVMIHEVVYSPAFMLWF